MNNRGLLIFLSCIFFILVLGLAMAFAFFNSDSTNKNNPVVTNGEKISCFEDSECDDGDACTLDYCNENSFCANTKVMLCYHNDGCCPKGCTKQNDNDCY